MSTDLDVSRETSERLEHYLALLRKWNPRINLVAPSTLADAWSRHIVDSAQLFDIAPRGDTWVDIGSGGGFPGLVCAVIAAEKAQGMQFVLIESDARKCAFLRTCTREFDLNAKILTARIEAAPPQGADILSARALADLSQLLGFADRHLSRTGAALFQKGRNWKSEVQIARETWQFDCEAVQSKTEEGAAILKISHVSHG